MPQDVLLNYGLAGVVILALSYAVKRLYSDLQRSHKQHLDDLGAGTIRKLEDAPPSSRA